MAALLVSESELISKNQKSKLIFGLLDSQKAFDVVHHDILLDKLFDQNIDPDIWEIIFDMYNNLTSKVKWKNGFSNSFPVRQGVRHGGFLSTHLYKLYINDLLTELEENGMGQYIGTNFTRCPTCADDIILLSSTEEEMQSMLDTSKRYSDKHRYKIHPTKSVTINKYSNSKTTKSEVQFKLDDTNMPSANQDQLPSKLSWKCKAREAINNYWKVNLQRDANSKTTLKFLCIPNLDIGKPHTIWNSLPPNIGELRKATIKARLCTGTYIFQLQKARFSNINLDATCPICQLEEEDIIHFLTRCPVLEGIRRESLSVIKRITISKIGLGNWNSNFHERTCIAQLILDCQQLALNNILPHDDLFLNSIEELSRNLCFPVVSVGDRTVTAEYGHGVILECSITADPPVVTVYWQKEHDGIKTNITSTTPGIDGVTTNRPSLTIKETKDSDSGIYICCAINAVGLAQSNNINLTVEGNMNYPFVQLNHERSIQVKYGGTFSLKSYIRSNKQYPIREIYWQYINNGIVTRIDSKTDGNNIDNSSLTFMHVTTSESGQFTCFATNDVGTSKSNSIDVKVNGATPNVTVKNTRYESVFGEMVELVCQISAEPPLTNVYWEKMANDTRMIINTGSVGYQNGTRANPSLTITYSTMFDTGNYTCLGSNSVGISRSESISLHVIGDLPEVSVPNLAVNVNFGDSVNLRCNVTAKSLHNFVYWEHKDTFATRRILTGTVGTEGSTVETPSLTLKYATNTVSGLYTCFARNAVGTSKSSTINLTVYGGKIQK
ncbi:unnamed protein product [Mytilus coruscus]|uniref:HMCN n=1 Tax=Mytilus coruscus TaxID=42192 RepID=A0A6J8BGX8_MYTCO|nr:unnamed protein product [Mytilus coruscus]